MKSSFKKIILDFKKLKLDFIFLKQSKKDLVILNQVFFFFLFTTSLNLLWISRLKR